MTSDTSGQIYVASAYPLEILVYAPGASGSATPVRTITSGSGGFSAPKAIAVDATGQVYLLDQFGGIFVFAATATGAATPTRIITGAMTGFTASYSQNVGGLAVDSPGNIYASIQQASGNVSSIFVFSATANGNVAPTRTITSTNSGNMLSINDLAIDSSSNLYVGYTSASTSLPTIAVFGPTANGTATPSRTIAGALTQLGGIYALRVDAVGNIYALNSTGGFSVAAFGPSVSGNIAPAVQISSSGLVSSVRQMALK